MSLNLNNMYLTALESITDLYGIREHKPKDNKLCKCGCGRKSISSEFYSLKCAMSYKASNAE